MEGRESPGFGLRGTCQQGVPNAGVTTMHSHPRHNADLAYGKQPMSKSTVPFILGKALVSPRSVSDPGGLTAGWDRKRDKEGSHFCAISEMSQLQYMRGDRKARRRYLRCRSMEQLQQRCPTKGLR